MWHTNNGDRTLEGAEVRLFAYTLWDFLCELEVEEGDFDTGLRVFDCMTYGQKLSMLSAVANGLLKPDVPIRKLAEKMTCALLFNEIPLIEVDPSPESVTEFDMKRYGRK